jgi:hypothetical protein
MTFENHLTNADIVRASMGEMTPRVITAGNISQLNAIVAFWADVVHPFVLGRKEVPLRDLAFSALCDRMIGHARVVPKLTALVYQQSVTAAERSVIELWLDIQLLHRDVIPDGVHRLFSWAAFQKLAGARRDDSFFAEHPALDTSPSEATPHRAFIASDGAAIDATAETLWSPRPGKKPSPQHWSDLSLLNRAKEIGSEAQLLVLRGYDMRNFAVHSGVAGMVNLPPNALELVFVQSAANVAKCMVDALRILEKELKIGVTVEAYSDVVDYIADQLPSYAVADIILRGQGEPQRYFYRKGPWGVRDLSGQGASADPEQTILSNN